MKVDDEKIIKVGCEIIGHAFGSGLSPVEQALMFDTIAETSKRAALLYVLVDLLGDDAKEFIEAMLKKDFEKVINEAEEAINGD